MTDKRKQEIWKQLIERLKKQNELKRTPNSLQVAEMKQQLAQADVEAALESAEHAQSRPTARS